MARRFLLVDNDITNSDWVKANAFDFPGVKTVEDFERALDVPVSEPARTTRLQALAQLPWAKVTPKPIYDLLFPYATANKSLIDLIKASFGGDRSAAGRYAAEQRWKGNRKKDKPKGKKRVSADGRTKEQKMSDGPLLANGRDEFGFPVLLSLADAQKKFGATAKEITEYFKTRGLTMDLSESNRILIPAPELYAALQGVDDVLDNLKTQKGELRGPAKYQAKEGDTPVVLEGTQNPLPHVLIANVSDEAGAIGGTFDQTAKLGGQVEVFAGVWAQYKDLGEGPGTTIPQLAAAQAEEFSKTGQFRQRVVYGCAVHELGHYLDNAMRTGAMFSFWSTDMREAYQGMGSESSDEYVARLSDE